MTESESSAEVELGNVVQRTDTIGRYAIESFPVDVQRALINPAADLFRLARAGQVFLQPAESLLPALNIAAFFAGQAADLLPPIKQQDGPPIPEHLRHTVIHATPPSSTGSIPHDVITCDQICDCLSPLVVSQDDAAAGTDHLVSGEGLRNLGKILVPMLVRLIPELLRLIAPAI